MCIEDVRIGRRTHVREIKLDPPAASAEVIGSNPDRIALVIGSDPVTAILLNFGQPGDGAHGILIPPNSKALVLSVQIHGEIVFGPVFGMSAAAAAHAAAWETILEER